MISNFSNRLGEIFTNNSGLKMTIIEYVNNKNVTVEFESGYTKTTNMSTIKRGEVRDNIVAKTKREAIELARVNARIKKQKLREEKNAEKQRIKDRKQKLSEIKQSHEPPKEWCSNAISKTAFTPTVHGIGSLGVYDKTSHHLRRERELWRGLLRRCYSGDGKDKSYYMNVKVCKRWHCFATFQRDIKNLIGYDKWKSHYSMHLDKDLLSDVKVYAPETCIFLDASINKQLQNRNKLNIARDRISQGLVKGIPPKALNATCWDGDWLKFIQEYSL